MSGHNFQGLRVTAKQLALHYSEDEWFRLGYQEAFKGIPMRYDIGDQGVATAYERGRAFAVWCKAMKLPRAVWRNGRTAKTVIERLSKAVASRAVF